MLNVRKRPCSSHHSVITIRKDMSEGPIYCETISVRASVFDGFPIKAAIDKGNCLTKIIFAPKDVQTHNDFMTIKCLTFNNDYFDDALLVLKKEADLPEFGQLHVTGVIFKTQMDKIKEILGLDAVYIDGSELRGRGVFLLLNSTDTDKIFHPQVNHEGFIMEFFEEEFGKLKDQVSKEEATFPAILINIGSDSEISYISKEGKCKFIGRVPLDGSSITGLANLIMGVHDYDELMSMATTGDRNKVDLLVKDLYKDDVDPAFGKLPRDMPIFPFSKCSEPSWSDTECNKNDIAQALIALLPAVLESHLYPLVFAFKVNRIYITGNIFRAEIVRNAFYQKMALLYDKLSVQLKFIKTDQARAIAAMLTNQGEEKTFLENSKSDELLKVI